MEQFHALLALCAGNSAVTGEFPSQRPVTPSHRTVVTPVPYNGIYQWTVGTLSLNLQHDVVTKWNNFTRYWPFVLGIRRSPVNSPHKGP